MIYQLSLANLSKLDLGKADVAFQRELARVAADCHDRSGDDRARTITLTCTVKPITDPDGGCDEVHAQIVVASKLPDYRTKTYAMGLRAKAGQIVFNEDNLNDANPTFFDEVQ